MPRAVRLGILVVIGALALFSITHRPANTPAHAPVPAQSSALDRAPSHPEIAFRSQHLLNEHFEKHGRAFGSVGIAGYLRFAQALRDRPAGGNLLEATRDDGVVTRFDRASGAFLAFNPDLTIRTCFRPNDGEAYFRRQLLRGPRNR